MSINIVPALPLLGLLYLLTVPFVANATVLVRQRVFMRKENHPESAIDRATSSMLADLIESTPPWRSVVMIRPLAVISVITGPILLVMSIGTYAVVAVFVVVTLLFCDMRDDLGALMRKAPLSPRV